MEDTRHAEDYVFLAKQAYTFGQIKHGDIIVFESMLMDDNGANKNLIKQSIKII
jgi:signal peptidase I